jgi:hypothetical protein
VLGLVRVDARSLEAIEAFLAEAAREPVRLGRVWLATGTVGALVAAVARAGAITFGGVIFLDRGHGRRVRARPATPALGRLGALLVHECVHVWQYRRDGTWRFLRKYLFSYFNSLYKLGSIERRIRFSAYAAIPAEQEAHALEGLWRRHAACSSLMRSHATDESGMFIRVSDKDLEHLL